MAEKFIVGYEELKEIIKDDELDKFPNWIAMSRDKLIDLDELPIQLRLTEISEKEIEIKKIIMDPDGNFPPEFAAPIRTHMEATYALINLFINREQRMKNIIIQIFNKIKESLEYETTKNESVGAEKNNYNRS